MISSTSSTASPNQNMLRRQPAPRDDENWTSTAAHPESLFTVSQVKLSLVPVTPGHRCDLSEPNPSSCAAEPCSGADSPLSLPPPISLGPPLSHRLSTDNCQPPTGRKASSSLDAAALPLLVPPPARPSRPMLTPRPTLSAGRPAGTRRHACALVLASPTRLPSNLQDPSSLSPPVARTHWS